MDQTDISPDARSNKVSAREVAVRYRDVESHLPQKQMVFSVYKRKIIRAGRRGGKTTGAATLSALQFWRNKRRILYATPTADQIKKFWFEVKYIFAELIDAGVVRKNETDHSIEIPGTQQRIRAKTAWNADTLRGDYADVLILDEWQLMDESAWEDVGAPMLIDNNGDAVFIYTPPSLKSRSVSKATDPRHAAKMFKRAQADKSGKWLAMHFTSFENPFVSEEGLKEVSADMTELSRRQELLAEDIEEVPGALWKLSLIDQTRISIDQLPKDLETVVIGVDPTGSTTNEAGIVCTARGSAPKDWTPTEEMLKRRPDLMSQKHGYVLEDGSLLAPQPSAWATRSVNMFFERKADCLLGERNYGGDMVQSTIRQVPGGDRVTYTDANATRGKIVRAEPVAAAYECGMFHHVGVFPELEEEMTSYVPGNPSPNRMDAMVWGGLRAVEGMDVYGMFEFFESGQAQEVMDKLAAPTAVKVREINVDDRCPSCSCLTSQVIAGGQQRCMECGHQWWKTGGAKVYHGQTRSEYLRSQGERR